MDETTHTEATKTEPDGTTTHAEKTETDVDRDAGLVDDAALQHNADPVHSAADTAHTAAVEHLNDAALHGAGVARELGGDIPE